MRSPLSCKKIKMENRKEQIFAIKKIIKKQKRKTIYSRPRMHRHVSFLIKWHFIASDWVLLPTNRMVKCWERKKQNHLAINFNGNENIFIKCANRYDSNAPPTVIFVDCLISPLLSCSHINLLKRWSMRNSSCL